MRRCTKLLSAGLLFLCLAPALAQGIVRDSVTLTLLRAAEQSDEAGGWGSGNDNK